MSGKLWLSRNRDTKMTENGEPHRVQKLENGEPHRVQTLENVKLKHWKT